MMPAQSVRESWKRVSKREGEARARWVAQVRAFILAGPVLGVVPGSPHWDLRPVFNERIKTWKTLQRESGEVLGSMYSQGLSPNKAAKMLVRMFRPSWPQGSEI